MSARSAGEILKRCDLLAGVTEEEGMTFRPYGSPAMRRVNELVGGWMEEAGMEVREDAIGNLVGRYDGTGRGTLVLGSHLDTVRDAGRYDGVLGVLLALACVEDLNREGKAGESLPFTLEVVAFADEEGHRFGTTYLGSSVYAGDFDRRLLERRDREDITLREAVRDFGGDPDSLESGAFEGREAPLGYCEVHIEQGPVLENEGLPLGVVTAITGQNRARVSFKGVAGHAGTVPMEGRRDALCAAAEFVLAVEEEAAREPEAVATVGEMTTLPGASNVIPGEARLSLDLRHQDATALKRVRESLHERAEEIVASRSCGFDWESGEETSAHSATPMDELLSGLLGRAAEEVGLSPRWLPSGAGHDAARMASLAPSAMLFVRCAGGVSHNPAESVGEEDVDVAFTVLRRFIRLVAEQTGSPEGGEI